MYNINGIKSLNSSQKIYISEARDRNAAHCCSLNTGEDVQQNA